MHYLCAPYGSCSLSNVCSQYSLEVRMSIVVMVLVYLRLRYWLCLQPLNWLKSDSLSPIFPRRCSKDLSYLSGVMWPISIKCTSCLIHFIPWSPLYVAKIWSKYHAVQLIVITSLRSSLHPKWLLKHWYTRQTNLNTELWNWSFVPFLACVLG